jgi:hypothetical protein
MSRKISSSDGRDDHSGAMNAFEITSYFDQAKKNLFLWRLLKMVVDIL